MHRLMNVEIKEMCWTVVSVNQFFTPLGNINSILFIVKLLREILR